MPAAQVRAQMQAQAADPARAAVARAPISRGPGGGAAPLRANKGRDPGVRSRGPAAAALFPPVCSAQAERSILTKAD